MPRDVAGVSRIGMFEQIVTPSGDTFSPVSGTATAVNLVDKKGRAVTVSSCDRSPDIVAYKGNMLHGMPGMPSPFSMPMGSMSGEMGDD